MSIFNDNSQTKEESRRTILAVVISTVLVGAGFMVQNMLFPPAPQTQAVTKQTQAPGAQAVVPAGTVVTQPAQIMAPFVTSSSKEEVKTTVPVVAAPALEAKYGIETDLFKAELSNSGGDIVSLKLKKHKDKDGSVDLILPGSTASRGLSLAFGGPDSAPVTDLMNATWLDAERKTIRFSTIFYAKTADGKLVPFTYKKIYTFRDGEYLFAMAVSLEGVDGNQIPLNANGLAYTLSLGPQIGPRFNQLPKNADYRKYILEVDGKKKAETPKTGAIQAIKDLPSWGALAGKYFAFIAIPETPFANFSYLQADDPAIRQTNTMFLSRPAVAAFSHMDKYYFFFGPRTGAELAKYEYADKNSFGLSSMKLEDVTERSNILGWLETILKVLLNFFYRLIPNYGVAIILVTILIKAVFFPLTKKGSMSTARMQELQPKIQELQAKYKSNPQKLNQETAEFYKRENYNPMSGCLPMLIQMPLFFAMYSLFNNHFDLRGASFIPGWIGDLSLPETIWNFGAFRLPLVGWNDLRALPIIYLASQLLYGKFTSAPQSGQSANQMKLMMYGMPIMFFFVLYDVPSGLLIYWIVSNLLTIAQQVVINDILKKRKLEAATALAGGSGPGGSAGAKNAGKTVVKSAPSASGRSLGDKVKDWLENKAGEAQKATEGQNAKKPGSGKSGPGTSGPGTSGPGTSGSQGGKGKGR
ncbi:MAG: membrane protein insertase YidC [Spirochaetes bacterium]|nr:membrane protein insertase YidC [Spirochaetota bacterium]